MLDQQLPPNTAMEHLSVFQYISAVFQGDTISYPDELPANSKFSNSKKVDSLP